MTQINASELSPNVLEQKHQLEKDVSEFFKSYKGKEFNFKLLTIDFLTNRVLVDFATNHNSDNFTETGYKNKNY